MRQNYKSVEDYDLVSLLGDLPPGEVLNFSDKRFDKVRTSIGDGKRLKIWSDHKSELDRLLASYLTRIKEREVKITAGDFLRRFKEKEATVFLGHLVKLGVKLEDCVQIGENAAKQLKRYILWAISYKDERVSNKTSVKPSETMSINPEPSPGVYFNHI